MQRCKTYIRVKVWCLNGLLSSTCLSGNKQLTCHRSESFNASLNAVGGSYNIRQFSRCVHSEAYFLSGINRCAQRVGFFGCLGCFFLVQNQHQFFNFVVSAWSFRCDKCVAVKVSCWLIKLPIGIKFWAWHLLVTAIQNHILEFVTNKFPVFRCEVWEQGQDMIYAKSSKFVLVFCRVFTQESLKVSGWHLIIFAQCDGWKNIIHVSIFYDVQNWVLEVSLEQDGAMRQDENEWYHQCTNPEHLPIPRATINSILEANRRGLIATAFDLIQAPRISLHSFVLHGALLTFLVRITELWDPLERNCNLILMDWQTNKCKLHPHLCKFSKIWLVANKFDVCTNKNSREKKKNFQEEHQLMSLFAHRKKVGRSNFFIWVQAWAFANALSVFHKLFAKKGRCQEKWVWTNLQLP